MAVAALAPKRFTHVMRVATATQEPTLRCRERGHRRGALRQTKLMLELYKQSRPQ
jgi:hypothetical protein